MTFAERLFLERLRKEEGENALATRVKKIGLITLGFLMGVFAPIATDTLKQLFGIK